ncbi:MAG: hypothetical protein HC789_05885 [Microcoleus sp. CSU_2_2]|nr:hypothetical protein [Microcoleus sp. SU_5_3]NJS09934.1 hypothetical protein [Microcoleus sp. CSU_2_2]
MPRTPSEYSVHLLLEGGHREEVRFATLQDFQKWYTSVLVPKHDSREFLNIPIKNIQGEYMVVRPTSVLAIRVEPIFTSSIDRYSEDD